MWESKIKLNFATLYYIVSEVNFLISDFLVNNTERISLFCYNISISNPSNVFTFSCCIKILNIKL